MASIFLLGGADCPGSSPSDRSTMALMDTEEENIERLERIAAELHHSTGGLLPVDAFELARLCGLRLRPTMSARGSIDLTTKVIRYPARARLVRQHGVVAHEIGHFALFRKGEDHTHERSARYLAGALMLPRAAFLRDCQATDWDLDELRRRHPNASAEMVVVRMTQVSPACAWVWDDGAVRRRYGRSQGEDVEAIVDRVLAEGAPQRDGSLRAWPLLEQGHRRVVVVRAAA